MDQLSVELLIDILNYLKYFDLVPLLLKTQKIKGIVEYILSKRKIYHPETLRELLLWNEYDIIMGHFYKYDLYLTSENMNFPNYLEIVQNIGKLKFLTSIYISFNLENLPESIGNLINLKHFDCSNSNLKIIPDTFCNLVNLKSIYIMQNDIKYIPECIGNLKNLKSLYLIINKIEFLPESIGELINLQNLYLYSNNLVFLPHTIVNLKKLHSLVVYDNKLIELPENFGNLENITYLMIYKNNLKTLPISIIKLAKLTKIKMDPIKNLDMKIQEFLSRPEINLKVYSE